MTQSSSDRNHVLRTSCDSTLTAVRAVMRQVDSYLQHTDTPEDWREDLNIILAEVLSNIARHGYGNGHGQIELEIQTCRDELRCQVMDSGAPFDPANYGNVAPDPLQLHEGGYGWFLIRNLARKLTYCRTFGVNKLTFWVPISKQADVLELAK